jgi:hypothetical protein
MMRPGGTCFRATNGWHDNGRGALNRRLEQTSELFREFDRHSGVHGALSVEKSVACR